MSERFTGKVVWISGAAQGIGRGIAEYFASEGASVVLADIKEEAGEKLASLICSNGGKAAFFLCDVNNEASIKNCISKTVDCFNGINVMINNAAVNIVRSLHEYSSEEWDWQMGVNLKAIFLSFKYAYPYLKQQQSSCIVNMGSVSSFVGQARTPGYIASKGAVLMLTKSIAIDYAADGIRCNAVCPGITDTPMLREHMGNNGALQERLNRVPTGRILSPLDIARTVAYLSCDDSIGVTGTSILIDGGYLATAEWKGGAVI
jgi:NAD(P)-dependent dehydrogenase (short-subunit alcohol dehydrogenase family)